MPATWRKTKRHQVEPALADLIDAAADLMASNEPGLGVIVTEGPRTHKRQAQLKRRGATRTLHSKHIPELSPTHRCLAVQVAITLDKETRLDWPLYAKFASYVKLEATRRRLDVFCGIDHPTNPNGPHFHLKV